MNALFTHARPQWAIQGRDWPNRDSSRFVDVDGVRWHVQIQGAGPALLLVHGTGAATHSWRSLLPLLSRDFTVIAPDLPGHGFTTMTDGHRLSLPAMAHDLGRLLRALDLKPAIAVGHSAGAAILLRMAIDHRIGPDVLIGLNAAILPIRGAPIFSPLAKLLFRNPIAPKVFAMRAQGADATRRLLRGTGSDLDDRGIDLYARLFQHSGHVAATLGMMANWDLPSLVADLQRLECPLVLLAAADDKAVPPGDSRRVAEKVAKGASEVWPEGGHLLHETRPSEVAERITRIAREHGALPPC